MSPKDKKFVNPLLRSTEADTKAPTDASTEPSTQVDTEPTIHAFVKTPTEPSTQMSVETPPEPHTQASTQMPMSAPTSTTTYTSADDIPDEPVERRKRGKQAFDKIHIRWTLWINKKLKKRIDQLSKKEEISLVALAEEAFTDLLRKYEGK